jgi:metal-responsive CopG/Arc/MetJ family transcriptional regulator
MVSRPKISDELAEKIDEWIENNPEKGIKDRSAAVEYLVPKGIEAEKQSPTKQEIEQRLQELEKKID